MKKIIFISIFLITIAVIFLNFSSYESSKTDSLGEQRITWEVKSIDTMKYSRDLAGEKLNDPTFSATINLQVKRIADLGATHVALGTPYDEQFNPFLKRWVDAARRNNLKVWFRGNFAGWEGWFGYNKSLTRDEHLKLMRQFINRNGDLFENGDLFTPCPECENGGAGDPRRNGDVDGFRQFMIEEFQVANTEFRLIGKNVRTVGSMNYDVAILVMNEQTANKVGNLVVVDHYVREPQKLVEDIEALGRVTQSNILLGEFGVPIPDIHGDLTEEQQAEWIESVLELIGNNESVIGGNYWVGFGGSTAIFDKNFEQKKAAKILSNFYKQ